jgi:DNA-binding NtrC family response regulator
MDPLVTRERTTESRRRAVLVVEDDFLARWEVSEYLRETGFNVIEAVNASEALAAVRADSTIDVILCAIGITNDLGGEDFLRFIEKERLSLPVLIASDGLDQGSLSANTPTHAKIGKPYVMSDLEQRLRALIAAF